MTILERVTKAARETGEVSHQNPEAVARAAIATLFNWLGDPPQPVVDAAVVAANSDAATCHRIWSVMVSEMRKDAGF